MPSRRAFPALAEAIRNNKVQTLFIFGGNPAYNALANLNWTDLQKSVPTVVRLGYYEDETSELSQWHVPEAHFLEQWGDSYTADGTYCVIQPMILPLFNGLTDLDMLALMLGKELHGDKPDLVRDTFNQLNKNVGDPALAWNTLLRDGFMPNSAPGETRRELQRRRGQSVPGRESRRAVSRRARGGRHRGGAHRRLQGRRRPLRQQRLAAGNAAPDHQDLTGTTPR